MSASPRTVKKDSERAAGPARSVRCLIVQLSPLRESLRGLMALRAAKQLYPELQITYVTQGGFTEAAARVPWIESVIEIPVSSLPSDDREAITVLAQAISPLCDHRWDFLLNWSERESASWLTSLLPARVKLGQSRHADGSLTTLDGWSQFIQAIVRTDAPQNIHFIDILTTQLLTALQIHLGDPSGESEGTVTSKQFFRLGLDRGDEAVRRDPTRKWIGIQLGADAEGKQWPAEHWTDLCLRILRTQGDSGIVLLGSEADRATVRAILAGVEADSPSLSRNLVSLVGSTDFDTWASVVARCHWLVTPNPAAVQLAGLLGTRVFALCFRKDAWNADGPYGNGHYLVHRGSALSPIDLTPEDVFAAWSYAASEWQHRRAIGFDEFAASKSLSAGIAGLQILRSRIRGTQDGGGVVYETIAGSALNGTGWTAMVQGHIARHWFCGWTPDVAAELNRSMMNPELVRELRALDESVGVLTRILTESRRAAHKMATQAKQLKSDKIALVSQRKGIAEDSRRLMELDELLARLVKAQPNLIGFQHMSQVLMHNLRGESIGDLAKETTQVYDQLLVAARIFTEWTRKSLELVRPQAVRSPEIAAPTPLAP